MTAITKENFEKIHQNNLANIIKKLNNNKTLTAHELKLVEEARQEIEGESEWYAKLDEIAAEFSVTRRQVLNWKKDFPDVFQKVKGKGYAKEPIIEWVQENFTHETEDERNDPDSINALKKRQLRVQCEIAETKLAELKGRLTPNDQVEADVAVMIGTVRRRLEQIPSQLAAHITSLKPSEAEAELTKAIRQAMGELAGESYEKITKEIAEIKA